MLRLLGKGRTTSEIATQLRLSRKTVQTFVERLKKKLGAAKINQLIQIAMLLAGSRAVCEFRRWSHVTGLRKAEPCSVLYKKVPSRERLQPMKTTRHTINVPAEMEQLLNDRIRDFRSLSAYFVALCFADLLYLPKRPIAKAFANASWQQQRRAIEGLVTLRKQGWKGVNLKVHFDVVIQVEKVAQKCLKPDDWLLDHIQEELAFMRGADLRR